MSVVDRLRKILEESAGDKGVTAIAFLARELDVLHKLDDVRAWQIKALQLRLEEREGLDVDLE